MSEAWGNIVIKASDKININLSKDKRYVNHEYVKEFLTFAGLSPSMCQRMGFSIQGVKQKAGYVILNIFDGDWIEIARHIAMNGKNVELYANVGDEYGTNVYCALNQKGSKFDYWYEEEGDEWHQDDFDEKEFRQKIKAKRKEWLSLIPAKVKKYCPELTSQGGKVKNKSFEIIFNDNDQNKEEKEMASSWLYSLLIGDVNSILSNSKLPFLFMGDMNFETEKEFTDFLNKKIVGKVKEPPEVLKVGVLKTNMSEQYNLPEDTVVIVQDMGKIKAALFVDPKDTPRVFGILEGRDYNDFV